MLWEKLPRKKIRRNIDLLVNGLIQVRYREHYKIKNEISDLEVGK